MRAAYPIRSTLLALLPALCACASMHAQQAAKPVVLDSVVAVVNHHAILSSDIDRAMRLSALEPPATANQKANRKGTLERLISRELIQQQMSPEDAKQAEPSEKKLKKRIEQLRSDLPDCTQFHCTTDAGWAAFLAAHGISEQEAESYLRLRLSLLAYIESRFRQGIRISQEEIESYYRNSLVPQYPAGQPVPPLASVASRISEILLQQQVDQLFSSWLDNLRKQGDVEILDPTLAPVDQAASGGGDQ